MYFGLKLGLIQEDIYSNFIEIFTHNNQNTMVADIKIIEK
jgi:hypothetical protein